jgi:hypothetical protein
MTINIISIMANISNEISVASKKLNDWLTLSAQSASENINENIAGVAGSEGQPGLLAAENIGAVGHGGWRNGS